MRLRSFAHALAVIGLVSAAACGGSGPSTGSASTPTAAPTPPPVVKTAMATVDGKSMTILVDADKGMTLYWFTPDKGAGKVTCTGGCLSVWPPLELSDATAKPTGGAGVTGTLGTITDPNGKPMVTYNGWPVYFYAKDKNPGDTTGQNVGQKWFVVTPDLTPNT
jgi:predicted lipoprotein with Yx(FWY)xxD motif